jgi:hypothetical protein
MSGDNLKATGKNDKFVHDYKKRKDKNYHEDWQMQE